MTRVSCLWIIKSRFKNNGMQEAWGLIRIVWNWSLDHQLSSDLMPSSFKRRNKQPHVTCLFKKKLQLTFCTSLVPSVLKCPLYRLASCDISWVKMSQGLSYFLSTLVTILNLHWAPVDTAALSWPLHEPFQTKPRVTTSTTPFPPPLPHSTCAPCTQLCYCRAYMVVQFVYVAFCSTRLWPWQGWGYNLGIMFPSSPHGA